MSDLLWSLVVDVEVCDPEDKPDPERLSSLPDALGWPISRRLIRGKPMRESNPRRVFKRNGFNTDVFSGYDATVIDKVTEALDMLEKPGVHELLTGLEVILTVAMTFYGSDTPDMSVEVDAMGRLAKLGIEYGLDIRWQDSQPNVGFGGEPEKPHRIKAPGGRRPSKLGYFVDTVGDIHIKPKDLPFSVGDPIYVNVEDLRIE